MSKESSALPPGGDASKTPSSTGGKDGAPAGSGFYRVLGRVEVWITQAAVIAMTLLVLTSAVTRTAGKPQSWAVDLATFSFAWAVFVGADVALRKGKMISIDLVVERLPQRAQQWLAVVNSALVIVFLVVFVVFGVRLSYTTADRSFSGLPWLSYTWVTIAVPVGCLLMLYTMSHLVRDQVRRLRGDAS